MTPDTTTDTLLDASGADALAGEPAAGEPSPAADATTCAGAEHEPSKRVSGLRVRSFTAVSFDPDRDDRIYRLVAVLLTHDPEHLGNAIERYAAQSGISAWTLYRWTQRRHVPMALLQRALDADYEALSDEEKAAPMRVLARRATETAQAAS